MTIDEFREAKRLVGPDLLRATMNPTSENISRLMIKMALHGLVAVPFDHYPDTIPQPLCAMVFIPGLDQPDQAVVNTYLVPADQIA